MFQKNWDGPIKVVAVFYSYTFKGLFQCWAGAQFGKLEPLVLILVSKH
jgi:hypothetical protein